MLKFIKKNIVYIMIILIFCFIVYLWRFELSANDALKERIDQCNESKSCGIKIEEPLAICPEVECEECKPCPKPVYFNITGEPTCPECSYTIWENRVDEVNRQLKECLLQYKLNCRL